MELYSNNRPLIGDRPQLLWEGASIQGVVPSLYVTPAGEGNCLVEVCILIAPNTARWLSRPLLTAALSQFISAYEEDPEGVLKDTFNWTYTPTARAAPRTVGKETLSLEDLGL